MTKNIATHVTQTYKNTQDSQKSGIGAKASFYADEPKYNATDLTRDQRHLNSQKRNLDGEVSSLIKGGYCDEKGGLNQRQHSLKVVSPFNDREGPSAPVSPSKQIDLVKVYSDI